MSYLKTNCFVCARLLLLLIVIIIAIQGRVHGHKYLKSYHDFPPLYNFDDYDSCLISKRAKLSSTYCMVYAEIKPDNISAIWQKIVQHTEEYKFHYRHDQLFFGVCLERCKDFVNFKQNSLKDDDILKNENTNYFDNVHKRALDQQMRKEYHALIHNCLNYDFARNYDLNLRTYIEYCERSKEFNKKENDLNTKDPFESLLFNSLTVIVILNILSTLYDFSLKRQQPEENQTNGFYKINHQDQVSGLLTSFSICRNYYRLIQPCFSEVGKDLCFLDGFRSACTLLVLYGHVYFIEYQHISNPEYFEKNAENKMLLPFLNTTMVIEIFFVMSGMLLYIKFQQGRFVNPQTSFKKLFKTYSKFIVFRYLRFLPSLGLFTLTNATILTRLQDGPFWRHITEPIRIFSREKWWQNIFMLNNFAGRESASHHTWYLAADFQLFAFYLLILTILAKYPKYKNHTFSLLSILAFVIPFGISYIKKLEAGFIINPECYRYAYFKDIAVYYEVYQPFYTNLGGYLFGIAFGELYLKYTRTEEIRKKIRGVLKYEIGVWLAVPAAIFIFWSGSYLILKEPSIWSSLYAGLHRLAWILLVCGLPLLCMTCKAGWIAYEFCCLPVLRFFSRLSFQVYLWHMTILYLLSGYQRQPVYANTLYFCSQFTLLFVLSYVLAFFIALFVEYPIAQSVQVLQSTKNNKNIKKSLCLNVIELKKHLK